MIIRRKPLGSDNIRQPQSLGLSLLRQGIARVQALTVRRSSEPDQTPDWGDGIPQDVFNSIYDPNSAPAPAIAATADNFDPVSAEQSDADQFDQGYGTSFGAGDSVSGGVALAERPTAGSRPPSNTARRTVRRQPQAPVQQAPEIPAQVQRQAQPPAALPAAAPPAEITPAPRPAPRRPIRRQPLSDGDNMPPDLQAMWDLHKKLGHIREKPTGEAAQREALERANRPRRKAAIVEMTPPKKGLPLDVSDPSIPPTASPIGEPIQRKADGSLATVDTPVSAAQSNALSVASGEPVAYTPNYYGSDDDLADFTPVNNTFDGGDSSPEAEFAEDVVDDSAGYDSSATLVDFSSSPNEVRRMPQGGPPNTTPNVPRAEARDSHAGQVDSASVQRTPTGSTREFAPSPSLENDPLADSDEPGPAGTALAPFTPDTVQRSTAVQSAIARAENPSVPDDEPDYYDPMGDDSGSSVTGAPPATAQHMPNHQDRVPNQPQSSPSIRRSAVSPSNPAYSATRADSGPAPESPVYPVQHSVQRSEVPADDSDAELGIADDVADGPAASSVSSVQRSTVPKGTTGRAEQPTPPETPDGPTVTSGAKSPTANPPQSPIQRSTAFPGQPSVGASLSNSVRRQVDDYDTDSDNFDQPVDIDLPDNAPYSDDFSDVADTPITPDIPQPSSPRVQRAAVLEPLNPSVNDDLFNDMATDDWSTSIDQSIAGDEATSRAERPAPNTSPRVQRTAAVEPLNPSVDDDLFDDVATDDWSAPIDQASVGEDTINRAERPTSITTPGAPTSPVQRTAATQPNLPPAAKANTPMVRRDVEAQPVRPTAPGPKPVQRSAVDDSIDDFRDVPAPLVNADRAAPSAEWPGEANVASDASVFPNGPFTSPVTNVQRTPAVSFDTPDAADGYDASIDSDTNWSDSAFDAGDDYYIDSDQGTERPADSMAARPGAPIQRMPMNAVTADDFDVASADLIAAEDAYSTDRATARAAAEPVKAAPVQPTVRRTPSSSEGDYDAAADPFAYDAEYESAYPTADVTYDAADDYSDTPDSQDVFDPGTASTAGLPTAPGSVAVQRYAEAETLDSSVADVSQAPVPNWSKPRRKAAATQQSLSMPQAPAESIQRSPDGVVSFNDPVVEDTDDSFETDASAEEVGLLAILGLPPSTPIARGTSRTTEVPPPPVQRKPSGNSAQRAVEIAEMSVNSNIPEMSNNNVNSNSTNAPPTTGTDGSDDSQPDTISSDDIEQVAQEVYRQLRSRLRTERERTRG